MTSTEVPSEAQKSWERPWTLAEIRSYSGSWNLAGDAGLLRHLQEFSQNLVRQTHEIENEVNGIAHATQTTAVRLRNVTNEFLALSNSQFVENRVYDDETTPTVERKKDVSKEQKPKTKEEREAEMIPKITEALAVGMSVLDVAFEKVDVPASDSDDEDSASCKQLLKAKNPYRLRPLPFLIGSKEFMEDDKVGLRDSSSEEETESETDESEDEVEKKPVRKAVLESDSEEETSEELESDSEEEPERKSTTAAKRDADFNENLSVKSDSLKNEFAKTKPRTDNFFGRDDEEEEDSPFGSAGGLFSGGRNLFKTDQVGEKKKEHGLFSDNESNTSSSSSKAVIPPAKKSGGGLFDKDESDEDDIFAVPTGKAKEKSVDSLFDDVSEKPISLAKEKKVPPGGVSLFGGVDPFAEIKARAAPSLSDSTPSSNTATPRSISNASLTSKSSKVETNSPSVSKKPSLFGDGDASTDLFSTKTSAQASSLFDETHDTATKTKAKPVKAKSLFDDSDSDDDLFSSASSNSSKTSKKVTAPPSAPKGLFDDIKKDSKPSAGLFDDDDLFSKPPAKPTSLFDDDDGLFGGIKTTRIKSSFENDDLFSNDFLSSSKKTTTPAATDDLFKDDSAAKLKSEPTGDDLFSSEVTKSDKGDFKSDLGTNATSAENAKDIAASTSGSDSQKPSDFSVNTSHSDKVKTTDTHVASISSSKQADSIISNSSVASERSSARKTIPSSPKTSVVSMEAAKNPDSATSKTSAKAITADVSDSAIPKSSASVDAPVKDKPAPLRDAHLKADSSAKSTAVKQADSSAKGTPVKKPDSLSSKEDLVKKIGSVVKKIETTKKTLEKKNVTTSKESLSNKSDSGSKLTSSSTNEDDDGDDLFAKVSTKAFSKKSSGSSLFSGIQSDDDDLFSVKPKSTVSKPAVSPSKKPIGGVAVFAGLVPPSATSLKKPDSPKSLTDNKSRAKVDRSPVVSPSKLPSSLHINPATLLPGASSSAKVTTPESVSFGEPAAPNTLTSLEKSRPKIQKRRRPQTRAARHRSLLLLDEDAMAVIDGSGENNSTEAPPAKEEKPAVVKQEGLKPLSNPLSPSTEEEDFFTIPTVKSVDDFDSSDLFSPVRRPSTEKKERTNPPKLFSDDDEDEDDLFAARKPTKSSAAPSKNLFSSSDDDEALFSTKSDKGSAHKQSTPSSKSKGDSLFRSKGKSKDDDDYDDDLFGDPLQSKDN